MTADTIHFVRCWVDGGVLGRNPSPRGVYWSVRIENFRNGDRPIMIRKRTRAYRTNNEAEYLALREVLLWLNEKEVRMPVVIYSDSKLIVNQFNDRFATNVPALVQLRDECRALAERLKHRVILTLAGMRLDSQGRLRRVEKPRATMVRKLGH